METMYGHQQKKMNCGEIYILQMTYISNMKTKIVILEIHSYARHWEKNTYKVQNFLQYEKGEVKMQGKKINIVNQVA